MGSAVKRNVLLAAILGSGLVFLDSSITGIALPAIQRDLDISTSTQQWVVSAYLLTLSSLLLVGGRLADLFGRKRMFVIGLWAYAVLASSAGLATGGAMLVALRALQGIAGAVLVPTTLALINSVFPAEERGHAIGQWAAWSGIATIAGPIAGGLAIDRLSWRFAFFIAPVVAIAALVLSRDTPESSDETGAHHIDIGGVALIAISLGAIIFALLQGPAAGWSDRWVLAAGIGGMALLGVAFIWEKRANRPLVPIGLFDDRALVVANVVTFFVYAGLYGMFFYVPLYMQSALGASATVAGLTFVPITLLLFGLSPVAGRLNDRFGPRWLMCFGPLVAAVGTSITGMAGAGQLWTVLFPGIVVFGVGLGFTVVPVTATAIGSAPRRYSGVASGFNNAVSRIAGLVAIALMGIIVVQLWQGSLALASAGVDASARQALASVQEHAFVRPDTSRLDAADAARVRAVTSEAAARAYRNGMFLAAALVAAGGLISAFGMPSGRSQHQEELV